MLKQMSENRISTPEFSKFILEIKKFRENFPNYSVGDILYSLNREIKKTNESILEVSDEDMVKLLDKARLNEKR